MDLAGYWKFIKEAKIADASVNLPAVNRLFLSGPKNKF